MKIKPSEKTLLRRKLDAYTGFFIAAALVSIALFIYLFGNGIFNGYVKVRIERVFSSAYPGHVLRIEKLDYKVGANRIYAGSVKISSKDIKFKMGPVYLSGVRWTRLLFGKTLLADLMATASLDASNLDIEFLRYHYGIRIARLQASVAGSDFSAEAISLFPLIKDEDIFAAPFRTTRFRVFVPVCSVSGVAYNELFNGEAYKARSIELEAPRFDALVNRDKPVGPLVKSPLMVHEALAAILKPLQIDNLTISNGHLKYSERVVAGAAPGVLTFTAVNISADNIVNRGDTSTVVTLKAQGNLMDAGLLKVLITIPVISPVFSLNYSGTLSAMDLTRLNAFLDIAERIRVKSGSVQELSFKADVAGGRATGRVRAVYKDFRIAILDKKTDMEYGLSNQFATLMANTFKLRSSNARNASGALRQGEINYSKQPEDEFTQFIWYALRSGVLDTISR